MEILRKYYSSDGTPVSYGQCWVFSGVTTTGGCAQKEGRGAFDGVCEGEMLLETV